MDRLRYTLFAVLLVGMVCAPVASSQTAQSITILSGNGQIQCPTCVNSHLPFFLPMVVKVTGAGGLPIPNKVVNWVVTSSSGQVATLNFGPTTQTDTNGITYNTVTQGSLPGSGLQSFLQTTVTAAADSAAVTFTETQALTDAVNHLTQFVLARLDGPPSGTVLTGNAGGLGSTTVQVHVDAFGKPVQHVSVRLTNSNDPSVGATANCVTGPGADPGSVLTDDSGNAVCTPQFGPITGQGNVTVLVGGVVDATPANQPTLPVGYQQIGGYIPISVTTPTVGAISPASGNGQSGNPGQSLSSPLVARVTDATGASPIPGVAVTWTASPAGAATFLPITSTSDGQGLAQTSVTLSSSASAGQVTVTAALTGANSNISTTFAITVVINITVTGVQKLPGGDGQSAIIGTNFTQPLAVQVNTAAGPANNYPVSFTVSGPANIGGSSSSTVNTDSSGKAQVTLTAGATIGAVTVTASAGGQVVTFSETTIPVGPSLTTNSFFNAAGLKQGSMSPCSLVTIVAAGIAPGVKGTIDPPNQIGSLPLTLGPTSVTFNNVGAPVQRISNSGGQEQVTVQVPCEVSAGPAVPVVVNAAGGTSTVAVGIQPASPGIFEAPMSDGKARAVMTRADGSFVSLENPARRTGGGEVIRVYVTGLGPTAPVAGTNSYPYPGTDAMVLGQVIVGVNNSGARVVSARLAPTQIGVYEVAFQVDPNTPTGNDIVLSVAINPADGSPTQFSNGSKIPIQ